MRKNILIFVLISMSMSFMTLISCDEREEDECVNVTVELVRGGVDRGTWVIDSTFTELWCWRTVIERVVSTPYLIPDSPFVRVDTSYYRYRSFERESVQR